MDQDDVTYRVALYRWLGEVFRKECDESVLSWYRSDQGQAFFSSLAGHDPFAGGIKKIRQGNRVKDFMGR